ncbi:MAG TPA: dienelactone hydrolase family protein [Kofleriaceae bacterium]|nr:dienelactone hydrolase family protein [Kofleriaceae bacterium]
MSWPAGKVFEETIEVAREDGVHLRARRFTPDWAEAEQGRGAGVVVIGDSASATDAMLDGVVRPLASAGYFVVALPLLDEGERAIEDLEAGVLSVKELAGGRIGVLGLGAAGAVALAAAATLPQLDAVVVAGGPPPGAAVRLARLRASILLHRVAHGGAWTDDAVADLLARVKRSKAPVVVRTHDAADGFFGGDSSEARIAMDQTRDFLAASLT